jgi:DNA-binding Xre family transcriptional regulator
LRVGHGSPDGEVRHECRNFILGLFELPAVSWHRLSGPNWFHQHKLHSLAMPRPAPPPRTELTGVMGTRIQKAMEAHPKLKTQAKLADKSGIAQSSLSKVLQGDTDPAAGTLLAIADALGVSILSLLPAVAALAIGEDDF